MKNGTVMVPALFFFAGALLFQPLWREAVAVPIGPYQIAPQSNTGNAWVVNTTTGQLRLCRPPAKDGAAPECWPWTQ